MLDVFRKHATSWLIKVALFLIVLVFIFWGGYSYTSRDASRLARVNDNYITMAEFDNSYNQLLEMYRRQFGNNLSEEMINQLNLKKQTLNMMIDRYIVSKAAQDLGLRASAQEVQRQILTYPVFQNNGAFDQERYLLVLRQNRMSPETFEQQLREDLTLQNVEKFIKRQTPVTDEELMAEFRFNQSRIQLDYAQLNPQSFLGQVVTNEKALKDYFEKNEEQYKEPEKRKFLLVTFLTDSYLKDVTVSEDEIKEYYDAHQDQFHKKAEVKARHILFRVEENAPEEEVAKVKAEAQKVLEQAKKKDADFAELAKKYSQDPNAANGGDLGYFSRDRMVPSFAEAAFSLKPGEVSGLVRTPFGFHIIKVEDVRPERTIPLQEARAEIELALKRQKARDVAYEKARSFSDAAYASGDLRKAAQQAQMPVTETKDWLAPTGSLPEVTASPEVMKELFNLPDKGISDVLEAQQGFLIAQTAGIKAPEIPPYDQVKQRVEETFKMVEARKLAEKAAVDLLADAKKRNSLELAGKDKQVEVKKSTWFSRMEPDQALMVRGDLLNKLFELEPSKPFPESPLAVTNQYMVCQLIGKKSPPEGDYEKERPKLLAMLQAQKQSQLWQAWLQDQRKQADIEIFKEP